MKLIQMGDDIINMDQVAHIVVHPSDTLGTIVTMTSAIDEPMVSHPDEPSDIDLDPTCQA